MSNTAIAQISAMVQKQIWDMLTELNNPNQALVSGAYDANVYYDSHSKYLSLLRDVVIHNAINLGPVEFASFMCQLANLAETIRAGRAGLVKGGAA
jgi:hypothetical protein